ncbi:MAG: Biopolymer transport protein ExbB [Candidatus Anoxychlamydiales bacterium]|nr:Biopolymer transport protein ExbB [Candidatus Anoxychlamydiales bacterium]
MNIIFLSSPFFRAYSQSDLFGKFIFLSLFLLSIISWVVLVQKILLSKKLKKLNFNLESIIQNKKDHLLSIKYDSKISYPYFNIFKNLKEKTLEILNKNSFFQNKEKNQIYMSSSDIELIDSTLFSQITKEKKIFEKNLFILPTIVTLGPFLGLLGTVWGILITFSTLEKNSLINSNSQILSGLSMALATTVLGLLVAIPALIAYNYLKNCAKDLVTDLENFSHSLLTTVEIQYRKVDDK